jgi:hypothetical protein
MNINMYAIQDRSRYLDNLWETSNAKKRKVGVKGNFENFLLHLPQKPTITSCTPEQLRQYLIWKDGDGRTRVHDIHCPFMGDKVNDKCCCPNRLAVGTVSNLLQKLGDIFDECGRGRMWDDQTDIGNPVKSQLVKRYVKQIAAEQAKAHVLPKQAKPIFLGKIRKIAGYIDNQLLRTDISLRQRFVFYRDQAFLKLQYFAGDRASDLCAIPTQEIKRLSDDSGLRLCHTFTKTIRGNSKPNSFVIKKCDEDIICPVRALDRYVTACKECGVDLTNGYLFRIVSEAGVVLDQPVEYCTIYARLKEYLIVLGIFDGETPHSFRAGCAIFMGMSGAVHNEQQMMDHLGWYTPESSRYYSRVRSLQDSAVVAERLARSTPQSDRIEKKFYMLSDECLVNFVK